MHIKNKLPLPAPVSSLQVLGEIPKVSKNYYKPRIGEFKGVFNERIKLREEAIALDHQRLNLYYVDGPGDSREL